MKRTKEILNILKTFIIPKCELDFKNNYQLLIAVILSAQTTDKAVNKITPILFLKYKDFIDLKDADINDLINIIKPLGLANNKASSLIKLSNEIVNKYQNNIPDNLNDLIKLPGVGRKTANVVLALGFNIPSIAVDTHVKRVCQRLEISNKNSNELEIEKILMNKVNRDEWINAHHYLLLFGRYYCKKINPLCNDCLLKKYCKKI